MLRPTVRCVGILAVAIACCASADSPRPEITDKTRSAAEEIANTSLKKSQEYREGNDLKNLSNPRPFSGIADSKIEKGREQVLKYLGIEQPNDYNLYVFVSLNLPEEMLESYLREAMWTGAIIVFRGIPDNLTLGQFTRTYANQMIGKKGATAAIQIDPRLFDAFDVKQVPEIVYSLIPSQELCVTGFNATKPCGVANENDFWKMSGAVSLRWALENFQKANAPFVDQPLAALKKAMPNQRGKEVKPVDGDWDAVNPSQLLEAASRMSELGTVYQTPTGIAVGPDGQADTLHGITVLIPQKEK